MNVSSQLDLKLCPINNRTSSAYEDAHARQSVALNNLDIPAAHASMIALIGTCCVQSSYHPPVFTFVLDLEPSMLLKLSQFQSFND